MAPSFSQPAQNSEKPASSTRTILLARARSAHALINPRAHPPGLGELIFLSPTDRQLAHSLGYNSFSEIIAARAAGALGNNDGPTMLWLPELQFLNPTSQPEGEGVWRFFTGGDEGDEGLATMNFGGQYGLPDRPSARQVWLLRGLMQQDTRREDTTSEIDLVWVPGSSDPEGDETDPVLPPLSSIESLSRPANPLLPPAQPAPPPSSPSLPAAIAHFDPTNSSLPDGHSQLGGREALYDTRLVKELWVTVDRSRLVRGEPEPHKLWVHAASGWKRYQHADGLDWEDAKAVDKVNKFRDQTYERAGWPALREGKRKDYSDEQRGWALKRLGEMGASAGSAGGGDGEAPKVNKAGMKVLREEFEAKWPGEGRSEAALASLVERMREVWREKGGVLGERKGRGWWMRERGERMRAELEAEAGRVEDGEGEAGEGKAGEGTADGDVEMGDVDGENGEGEDADEK